jgi:hypothetical protein
MNSPLTRIPRLLLHFSLGITSSPGIIIRLSPEIVPIVGLFNITRTPSIPEDIPLKNFPGFATTTEFRSISNDGNELLRSVNQQTKYLEKTQGFTLSTVLTEA